MVSVLTGDVLEVLPTLADESVQCCATSPPYWGLRDYGTAQWEGGDPDCDHNPQRPDGGARADRTLPLGRGGVYREVCRCGARRIDSQIGLEPTPEDYVEKMVQVFREVRRVLTKDGTCWVNLGDSYNSPGPSNHGKSMVVHRGTSREDWAQPNTRRAPRLKPKDLCGIPWRVAFALQADGWYLRQDIIWHKPNPMPESVRDRCTKAHEYVFLLSKSGRYYFDQEAIQEPAAYGFCPGGFRGGAAYTGQAGAVSNDVPTGKTASITPGDGGTRNRRSVWTIPTAPYKEAHFAVFPEALVEPCILAGSRPGDVVLDPFAGSGTTLAVARRLGRRAIGVELNPEYAKLIYKRLEQTTPALDFPT